MEEAIKIQVSLKNPRLKIGGFFLLGRSWKDRRDPQGSQILAPWSRRQAAKAKRGLAHSILSYINIVNTRMAGVFVDKKCIGGEDGLIGNVLQGHGGRVRDGAADDPKANLIKPGIGFCGQIGEQQDGFGDPEVIGFVADGIRQVEGRYSDGIVMNKGKLARCIEDDGPRDAGVCGGIRRGDGLP
jgi:hypothetical protein